METKILAKTCPICDKLFESLSKNQLEYNFEQHMLKHKRKGWYKEDENTEVNKG